MGIKQKGILFSLLLGLFFFIGWQSNSNEDTSSSSFVNYEYLSLDEEYSDEINSWLKEVRNDSEKDLYHLSLDEGKEYIYGKGYTQAKVSHTYEDFDGKINRSITATLLEEESSDEIFVEITYNSDIDGFMLNVTDNKTQFYN